MEASTESAASAAASAAAAAAVSSPALTRPQDSNEHMPSPSKDSGTLTSLSSGPSHVHPSLCHRRGSSQQSHSSSQHHHHHQHQRHLSHNEEALMRERGQLDGDILELGITQPGTPNLTAFPSSGSLVPSPLTSGLAGTATAVSGSSEPDRLPLLPESAAVTVSVDPDPTISLGTMNSDQPASSTAAFTTSMNLDKEFGSTESTSKIQSQQQQTHLPSPVRTPYRRCLSGDDSQISTVGRSASGRLRPKEISPSDCTAPASPQEAAAEDGGLSIPTTSGQRETKESPHSVVNGSPGCDDGETSAINLSTCDPEHVTPTPSHLATAKDCREHPDVVVHVASLENLRRTQRSKSIDRALNEAVQFAEAVGEQPPKNEDEMRMIIEEADSSSDDDSDVDLPDEEEIAAEMAEIEQDEDAVESSFRRGASFRDGNESMTPISPYVSRSKYRRDDATMPADSGGDGSSLDAGRGSGLNNGMLNLSIHSASQGLPIAPDIRSTGPGPAVKASNVRREEYVSKREQEEEEAFGDEANERKESPRERRIYPRLPPLKQAPTSTSGCRSHHHMTLLNKKGPNGVEEDFSPHSSTVSEYKGIHSKYLEVTNRGISRGNYAKLHRKAWLEVSDKYHRYGKNLRAYYKHWESLGHPTNSFFDWLDSKGEAAGQPLPNLPECPRAELDSDTVLYITNPEVQERYRLSIVTGVVVDADEGSPERTIDDNDSDRYSDISTGETILVDADEEPVRTGPEGWIFVLRDHALYGSQKVTSVSGISKQRFHHSSFFGGKAVAAAGIIITDQHGRLRRMYPHSGHYRPTEAHMQRMLYFLQQGGFDLSTFEVDTQQILHVSRTVRTNPKGGASAEDNSKSSGDKKCKKVQSLHLKPALYVACYLAHKARMIGEGIFSQIHDVRTAGCSSVSEALDIIDEGGYWRNLRTTQENIVHN